MIEELVSRLPELYQPVYGHPELSRQASRPCHDRLGQIVRVHDALSRLLGRPLRVLDLGCAQGYFCFSLAERGAAVQGIDYLDQNIAVCRALADEFPNLQVSFDTSRAEDAIARIQSGGYDLVLGLSIFHHLMHEIGADAVKHLLERLAAGSGALLVELALSEEPLYWAASQPKDPRTLLDSIAFVHEIARHETHLGSTPRPLFVASNSYWVVGERAEHFERWSTDPHPLAPGLYQGTRRYFFSARWVLKLYRLDHERLGPINKDHFDKERQFFQAPPPAFATPDRVLCGDNGTEAWLAMTRLPGRLLLELLREGARMDEHAVLLSVLEQLAVLEEAGLFHDDVRTWNVLVAEDGSVRLIDYGSISAKSRDCVWPYNLFLAFFIFVREVATRQVDEPDPLRTVSISPFGLPPPYRAWATALWRRPLADWSFRVMHDTLRQTPRDVSDEPLQQPIEAWMGAIEEAVQQHKQFGLHLREAAASQVASVAGELGARLDAQQAQMRQLVEAMASNVAGSIGELAGRLEAQRDEIHALRTAYEARFAALQAERDALRASWSWRVTAPLRWAARPFMTPVPRAHAPSPATVTAPLRPLVAAMERVLRDPHRSDRLNQRLMRFPLLHKWLVGLSKRAGIYPGAGSTAPTAATTSHPASPAPVSQPLAGEARVPRQPMHGEPPPTLELTASARRIYQDLLDARAARKGA